MQPAQGAGAHQLAGPARRIRAGTSTPRIKVASTAHRQGRAGAQLRAAHQEAFDEARFTALPLPELLDRMVDPILAFNVAHPGFKALFARTDMPAGLADAALPVQTALPARVEAMIAARAPRRPAAERSRTALVGIRIFQAMVPLVVAAEGAERAAMTRELKRALHGYLSDTIG
ncbi:hypothetical protein [Streptomyces katrae]